MKAQRLTQVIPSFLKELWNEAQGAVDRTETQVRLFASRLVEKGAVTQEEALKLVNQLRKSLGGEEQEDDNGRLDYLLRLLRLPSRAEVEEMGSRVADIQRRIEVLENQATAQH